MAFHLTPYLTMVVVGFVSFMVVLAYGRFATRSEDRKTRD